MVVRLLTELWRSVELAGDWQRLLAESSNPKVLYQPPAWVDHLHAVEPDQRLSVAVRRNAAGKTVGIAPLVCRRYPLEFAIHGHALGRAMLREVRFLGCEPMVEPNVEIYDDLLRAIGDEFPRHQCLGFSAVETSSFLWEYFQQSEVVRDRYLPYLRDGVRNWHAISLPATFEDYLARFHRKKRYNLKRQLRLMEEHCQGTLRLHRIDSSQQVPLLIEAFESLTPRKWSLAGLRTSMGEGGQSRWRN